MAFSLLVLLFKAGQHGLHLLETAFTATEFAVVLDVLSLIDICLTGSLVVLVIFSGYENFVCRTDPGAPRHAAGMDDGDRFRRTENQADVLHRGDYRDPDLARLHGSRQPSPTASLAWSVGIHLTFVVSTVLLAWSDRIGRTPGAKPAITDIEALRADGRCLIAAGIERKAPKCP